MLIDYPLRVAASIDIIILITVGISVAEIDMVKQDLHDCFRMRQLALITQLGDVALNLTEFLGGITGHQQIYNA